MKKIVWLVVVALFIGGVVYTSLNTSTTIGGSSSSEEREKQTTEVNLVPGGSTELSGEEASIKATSNQRKVILTDLGMSCPNCEYAVSSGLKKTKGVIDFEVNLSKDRATVVFDPSQVTIDQIKQAIADVGYEVGEVMEVK
ncbi:heavy-metal-associated domain-containing protein [Cytobacillus sp. S13-E01]|uniref:heavy-metal-associated domain-containing protein n=1 Tax=Cytobacillus sp. S13-E01 TaxID=3031326 RepID=UPI0023D8647B|nr:heavy-metal-associated domain-containing protein [Cytobacillus sp. S13-E01]MDF0727731.1 heavy-metal-associated domain-containing protein [Cytobacillus sp. S13-E01]